MSNNIPFIHNYCDRWCERCSFTSRCGVFEMEATCTEEEKDMENEAFWKRFSGNMKHSLELLIEEGKEWGIDLENIPEETEAEKAERVRLDEEVEANEIILLLSTYADRLREYLDDKDYWTSKASGYVKDVKVLNRSEETVLEEVETVSESKEVLGWYMYFLEGKFKRALSGLQDSWYDPNEIQEDWNGSAKIAILSVEKCKAALISLFDLFGEEDRLLQLLSIISKVEKLTKEKFPRAMEFVRPGFDEVPEEMN